MKIDVIQYMRLHILNKKVKNKKKIGGKVCLN